MMILQLSGEEAVKSWTEVAAARYANGAFSGRPVKAESVMNWTAIMER